MKIGKITGRKGGATVATKRGVQTPSASGGSTLERCFLTLWRGLLKGKAPAPEVEFEFAAELNRKWRFDFAWPKHRVAVELEGFPRGTSGRHERPEGYTADCEKYNAALVLGWRVLRYTSIDMATRQVQVIEEVFKLLRAAIPEAGEAGSRRRPEGSAFAATAGGARPLPSKKTNGDEKALSIRLPPEVWDRVHELAAQRGTTMQSLGNEAIRELLAAALEEEPD